MTVLIFILKALLVCIGLAVTFIFISLAVAVGIQVAFKQICKDGDSDD